jgi:glycerophosphoryl diester phosphodiesterase
MGKKILAAIVGILGIVTIAAIVLVAVAQPAAECSPCLRDQPRPLVIAHQGGDGLWPSDTMYAFERAVALGVDMLEMDLHVTADGHPVLMHDETVDRTTNGTGRLEDLTLAQVKALDAGYRWTADDGQTFPYRGQGITVATVEELFQAFPDMPMNIEIKLVERIPIAEPFCQMIRQYNMQDKVLVASFHQDAMDAFRAACPEVSTSITQDEVINFFVRQKLGLAASYSPPGQAVQVPETRAGLRILTNGFVTSAQQRGMDVHAWTINEEADMQRMIDLGVNGIITDYPDRLLGLLGRLPE